jgi:hypothetical protein
MKEITTPEQLAKIMGTLDKQYFKWYEKVHTKKAYKDYMIRHDVLVDMFEEITDIDMPLF